MPKINASALRQSMGCIAFCALLIAGLWAVLTWDLNRVYATALKQAQSDTENLILAFKESVGNILSSIDQLMISVISENNISGKSYYIPTWVSHSELLKDISVQVSLIGPDGILVASSLSRNPKRIDLSDRPYFRYHLDPSAPQPYISVPVVGRVSDKWSIQITRRIIRHDGSFGGVVVVSLDPFYFSHVFKHLNLGKHSLVALTGFDGIVRSRRALTSREIGQNVRGGFLYKQAMKSGNGSLTAVSLVDHIERLFAYATIPNYPLYAVIGLATEDILAAVDRQKTLYFVIGGGLTAVIAALGWFLVSESQRWRERELAAVAEQSIHEQKRLLDAAINNMRDGLSMFDNDNRVVVLNHAYIEMYRLSPEKVRPGCTLRDLLEQSTAAGTFALDIDAVIKNKIANGYIEDKFLDIPDGRVIRIVSRVREDGGWVSTHEDVTARKRAEDELLRQKTLLDAAINNMRDGLSMFDQDNRLVILNNVYLDMYRLSPEKVGPGCTLRDLLEQSTAAGTFALDIDSVIKSKIANGYREDKILDIPDGRFIRIVSRVMEDGGWVSTHEDVTERNTFENELVRLNSELEGRVRERTAELVKTQEKALAASVYTEKMEAIGKLTGGMAHDFNNYLGVIIGNLDLASKLPVDDPIVKDLVEEAMSGALRSAELTKSLLAFSRRQPLAAQHTDIGEVLIADAMLLRRTLRPNITLMTEIDPDLWPAHIDRAQLDSCIINLVKNAADATPGHGDGAVVISACNARLDENYTATNLDAQPGDYVLIEISDHGAGMTPEIMAQVFEPFFTTKPAGHGTGLGLSMVYGFVKQSGGHIKLDSKPGRGTTVQIYLPRDHGAESDANADTGSISVTHGKAESILVVEDNGQLRRTVVSQLKLSGYQVIEAENGEAGLAILEQSVRHVDLLFSDVIMPGNIDGYRLAEFARDRRPGIKVLLTSGFPGDPSRYKVGSVPETLLSKPYRFEDLVRAIRKKLENSQPSPSSSAQPYDLWGDEVSEHQVEQMAI